MIHLLPLFLVLPQVGTVQDPDLAPARRQTPVERRPDPDRDADPAERRRRDLLQPIGIYTDGGIQAPDQPLRASSSIYTETPRMERAVLRTDAARMGRIQSRIRTLVGVRGREENPISGYGLIIGLQGTGDTGQLATQLLHNLLLTHNINIDPNLLEPENLAVVHVEAMLPAGMKAGQHIDARVSAIGDSTSLVGGNLVMCELFDAQGEVVYATASGPLTVGGFTFSGDAATTTKNHTTVGTLPDGAIIQREVPTHVVSEHGYIYLDAKRNHDSYGNIVRITAAVNRLFPGVAVALPDGKSVRVTVPSDLPESQYVAFLDTLLQQQVETDNLARVVINERTGTITMGGDVRLRPGVIAHSNLIVTISETPEISQPGALSGGQTRSVPRTDLVVREENSPFVLVQGATSLEEVVEVLNYLGTTPRDMISILIEMSESGMLIADIRRM